MAQAVQEEKMRGIMLWVVYLHSARKKENQKLLSFF
jgi:hypothetical protein